MTVWRRLAGRLVVQPEQPTPVREDGCPQCGHARGGVRPETWVDRWIPLRPLPARCDGWSYDHTGWGVDCGCRHPFHGS